MSGHASIASGSVSINLKLVYSFGRFIFRMIVLLTLKSFKKPPIDFDSLEM